MIFTRRNMMALVAGGLAGAVRAQDDPLKGRFGGPFDLQGADGRRVRDSDFRGQFMLVYFGYTHCPDICPEDLLLMTEALQLLGPEGAKIRPIFITVDPERDTAAVMQEYSASFSPRIAGLTGTEAEIAAVARAYRVHRRKFQPPEAAKDQGNYIVDHSSLKYLMGPDGAFVTLVPHGVSAEKMAMILRPYLAKA